jgi:TfoX/Sxy family transcriptional regulator of competence genes
MATKQSTVDFLQEQVQKAGVIRSRKMFGEYALYCNEKVVALICDDQLFVKPTYIAAKFLDKTHEAPPYPGSKNWLRVPEDNWDDANWLTDFIRETANILPFPKPKKKK